MQSTTQLAFTQQTTMASTFHEGRKEAGPSTQGNMVVDDAQDRGRRFLQAPVQRVKLPPQPRARVMGLTEAGGPFRHHGAASNLDTDLESVSEVEPREAGQAPAPVGADPFPPSDSMSASCSSTGSAVGPTTQTSPLSSM